MISWRLPQLIDLVVWSGAAFGFSWILADAKVSLPLRKQLLRRYQNRDRPSGAAMAGFLLALLECVACLGVWLGLIGFLCGVAPFDAWWKAAFFTCASNLLLARYIGLFGED